MAEWSDRARGALDTVFGSCAADPKGSVLRAWALSLVFIVVYTVLAVIEMMNMKSEGGSRALQLAALWTGLTHLVLALLGTFILRRFPTSFSLGFLLGLLVVTANQNLILWSTFHNYQYGTPATNHIFGGLGLALFCILVFFALLLFHFKKHIAVAPIDAKGLGRRPTTTGGAAAANSTTNNTNGDSDYKHYDDGSET